MSGSWNEVPRTAGALRDWKDEITLTPDAYDAHLGVDLAEAD